MLTASNRLKSIQSISRSIIISVFIQAFFFQEEKHQIKNNAIVDGDLLQRSSLEINLVPEHTDDILQARIMQHSTKRKIKCI